MKKSLLLLSMAALSLASNAQTGTFKAEIHDGVLFQQISPNGKWITGAVDGVVALHNTESGDTQYFMDENGVYYYQLGTGVSVDNNGVVLISDGENGATYWDGELKKLPVPEGSTSLSSANCITTDGKFIAGTLGLSEITGEDLIMVVPALWARNSEGAFEECIRLPYPTTDFTGRKPQYILVTAISEDGKTIAGQIVDYRGTFIYPIVWKPNTDNEWEYSFPTAALINPNNVVMPAEPGEGPAHPDAGDFLTDEQKAEYQEKYDAWVASGYNNSLYPGDKEDLLDEDQKAAYDAAVEAWQTANAEWEEAFTAYDNAYFEIIEASANFQQNQVGLSPDGKTLALTNTYTEVIDPDDYWNGTVEHNNVWAINLENGEIQKYLDVEVGFCAMAGDNILAASMDQATYLMQGYILSDGVATSLYDYLAPKGEDLKDWIDLNLAQQVVSYDENWQEVYLDVVALGAPAATPDLSRIVTWTYASWNEAYYESTYFDLSNYAGFTAPSLAKKQAAYFDKDGNLTVGADVATVAVYDLAGKCVATAAAPGQTVKVDCAKGLYIVKTVYTDGTTASSKLIR